MSVVAAIPVSRLRSRSDRRVLPRRAVRRSSGVSVRPATAADADAIYALVSEHLAEGHLLPRTRSEIAAHAHRFVVASDGRRVLACADLAPLSRTVAEVRSLVVSTGARVRGIGRRLVDEIVRRATVAGGDKLCAFTHSPA